MSSDADFVHLHTHTDYSLLDGAAKISNLVAEAAALGQRALAITDHGNVFGAYEFYQAAKKVGIKPIIGIEAYLTPGTSRFDKTRARWGNKDQQLAGDDVSAAGAYTHMTLLARNNEGMRNLFRLASLASLEGQMGKWPRMDVQLLQTYSPGLIGTTGCPSGEVQTRLRLDQWDEAVRAAGEMQDIFGKDHYFVEVMDHGLDLEKRVLEDLLKLAGHIGAKLIATNDSHYVKKEDHTIQDALLCINSGANLSDPNRFKFSGTDYYLRSGENMRRAFAHIPGACDNTLLVAEQCEVSFVTTDDGANFMPRFPVPSGEDENSWFVKEVERGLQRRFPNGITDEVRKRANYEVEIIIEMGFPSYFLVVADFITWAKDHGIRVGPGRGSGAGSMVAYALRITDLNPIEHGLLFERFLNPERVSMPDFDVDFDELRRGEVIDYVVEKYGDDRVAQVVTYGVIKSKQALKDASKILGYPFAMGEKLTKTMPPAVMGKDIPVKDMFNPEHPRYKEAEEFRKLCAEDQDAAKIVEIAKGLEGLTRQTGVHACAVIMSSEPLMDIVPIMKRPADGTIITQFDYPTCEALGLLKMDFLGLRNLTVISDALDNIVLNGGSEIDIEKLLLDDKTTYEMLSTGETLGVFQLDSPGMRQLIRQMRPDNFEDISALVALYRPGPMGADSHTNYALRKNGEQQIDSIHPELAEPLAEILDVTYGLIIYQEQVMAIAQKVAGYSLGQADLLRRAMGKKKKEILDHEYGPFSAGMRERGYSEEAISTLWDILVPFSDYAFNKSHSAAYALVAYWTAYLKANYPTEYMAALLTSQKDKKDKLAVYLGETRRMGITVLPPDVNVSAADFTPVGGDIRFGLEAIRNVGTNVVADIIQARKEKGSFTSFLDFLDKVPAGVCNKRTIESLIKAGAFDTLGQARRALLSRHEEAVDAVIDLKRNEAIGQFDLFAGLGAEVGVESGGLSVEIPDIPEWDKREKLEFEREMLGLYVSDHPLSGLGHLLQKHCDAEIATLLADESRNDDPYVKISGLITGLQRKTTKAGNLWAIATIEDLTGSIEAYFFPRTYDTVATNLQQETIVSVRGRFSREEQSPRILAQEMSVLDISSLENDAPVVISLQASRLNETTALALKEIISNHPGTSQVQLRLRENKQVTVLQLPDVLRVDKSGEFYSDIKVLLGANCLASS